MTTEQLALARSRTRQILADAAIVLTLLESNGIEIADFGLDRLEEEGLEIVTYINNDRYCAKELVMFPRQTCPEHRHPPVALDPGKTETFRVRAGALVLYVPGPATAGFKARVPVQSGNYYTVFHEIELCAGKQYTIPPNTRHWFQAGDEGAIISEFSSPSRDEYDVFTDPRIRRTGNDRPSDGTK
jgi:D-lyxose ketol-isomerase